MVQKYFQYPLDRITVSAQTSISDVLSCFQPGDTQIVLVVSDDMHLLGIITENDFPRMPAGSPPMQGIAEDIMNTQFTFATVEMDKEAIIQLMDSKSITQLPVVDNHKRAIDLVIRSELQIDDEPDSSFMFSSRLNKINNQEISTALASLTSDLGVEMFEQQLDKMSWLSMDYLYRHLRRKLKADKEWRYGDIRTLDWIKKSYEPFAEKSIIKGKTFCDMGCGVFHALGVGVFMYINGADSFYSTDISAADEPRAAEALADMLVSCMISPDKWHWSDISREEFNKRVRYFDIQALSDGKLYAGLKSFAENYLVESFYESSIPDESVDLLTSIAVLEHIDDMEKACRQMFRIMKPGGFLYHDIDLRDHRWWHRPDLYTPWSFLTTNKPHRVEMSNRLRANDLLDEFTRAGFQVVSVDRIREPLPDAISSKLAPRFQAYSQEDIETIQLKCMVTKPETA